ncbi:hypothetical protein ACFVTC_33670 [Streptomyces sp. NPDC057950]|uniref:hypothetical protein n=1 Tax=Streptomyces sp. NPDC057950 TaxID=3346288 RepID=UPI0036EF2933
MAACEYGCNNNKGGTYYGHLKPNGKGGWAFVSTEVYTKSYQYQKAGGGTGSGVMTVTVRTVEGYKSTQVMFRKGPEPAPAMTTGNGDQKNWWDKALKFNHDHREAIQLIGDAGENLNYGSTTLAGVCVAVTIGACAAGPAEILATIGKVGAVVSAASSVSQAIDSCEYGGGANCAHDVNGALFSTVEIAIPYLPKFVPSFVERAQEAYMSGDSSSLIHRLTKWMF